MRKPKYQNSSGEFLAPLNAAKQISVTPFASAQSGRGTITGSVKDSSGAVVPNAPVILTEVSTGSAYKAQTNGEGIYNFPELQPGTYSISVSAPSLKAFTQTGITVTVGNTAKLDVVLQVGSSNQTITVNSDVSLLQTESSDVGTTVSTKLIEDLPLQFSGTVRNPLQFVQLTPGFSGID
jgi:hypothetical protein